MRTGGAGDRTTDLPIYLLNHRLPSMQLSPACSLLQLLMHIYLAKSRMPAGCKAVLFHRGQRELLRLTLLLPSSSSSSYPEREGLLSEGLLSFSTHLRACVPWAKGDGAVQGQ